MFEWILLAVGIVGFGLASWWDLKTTEFPDWLPYVIIILALVIRGAFALATWNLWIFLAAVFIGAGFLAFGLLLYFLKQWGDGDAWLLGALGFLFPSYPAIVLRQTVIAFPLAMLFNFFIIAFFYLIAYSLVLGLRSPAMVKKFWSKQKTQIQSIGIIVTVFSVACLILVCYLSYALGLSLPSLSSILLFPGLLLGLLMFVYYGKFIENKLFKRRILAKNLKMGDVPIDEKWKVLTAKDIAKLRQRVGYIWIKEGARLAPVFLLALIITVFFGCIII